VQIQFLPQARQTLGYNNGVLNDLIIGFLVTSIRLFFKSHLALTLLLPIAFLTIFTGLDDSVMQVDEGADTFVSTTILKHGLPMHSDGLNHTMPYADIFEGLFIYRTWVPYYLQAISLNFLGKNTFAARLPFALAGFFSIWCLYHLAIRITQDKSASVLAATFLATCVPALLYFRTSRYVAIPILLTPILLSFYIDIFEKKKWNPVPFTVTSIIFFHTMYVEFAGLITGMLIHLFIYRNEVDPNNLIKIKIPAAVTALLCLPWLFFLPALSKKIAEFYTSTSPYIDTSSLGYLKHFAGFLFQINNYIFPLILVPLIFLLPIKKFNRSISLLLICIFFILLTASLHSIPQLHYIAASIPIFFTLLGWINVHLFRSSIIQKILFAAILIFSNLVHVGPLVPVKQLLQSPKTEVQLSLYLKGVYQTFKREVKIKSIFFQYWGELTNPYRGPLNEIVAFFETQGKKGDTCYIDNEVESLAFYTGFKMIQNSELTNKSILDWIVLRGDQWALHSGEKASPLKKKLRFILRNNEYEQFELNAPVKRVNNSYEIQIHLFKSPVSADKVYIFRRIDKN
jgi:hypothetical protein